jgi:hypothetical protein
MNVLPDQLHRPEIFVVVPNVTIRRTVLEPCCSVCGLLVKSSAASELDVYGIRPLRSIVEIFREIRVALRVIGNRLPRLADVGD